MGDQGGMRTRVSHLRGRLSRTLASQPDDQAKDLQQGTFRATPPQAPAPNAMTINDAEIASGGKTEALTDTPARGKLKLGSPRRFTLARRGSRPRSSGDSKPEVLGTQLIIVTAVAAAGIVASHQLPHVSSLYRWTMTPGWLVSLLGITLLLALIGTIRIRQLGGLDRLTITVFYIALGIWILTLIIKPV